MRCVTLGCEHMKELTQRRQGAKRTWPLGPFAPLRLCVSPVRRAATRRTQSGLSRSGISLLEVLVSIFVLTIGLLGVAAMIPIGKLALIETNKSDRTGACGRAGLREVKVRRMLEWAAPPGAGAFAIDPLGSGSLLLPRVTLSGMNATQADYIFRWRDDLIFTRPEDIPNATQHVNGDRPVPTTDSIHGGVANEGNFSWFLTVSPSAVDVQNSVPVADRRQYSVSVVVCHKRDFTADGTQQRTVSFPGGIGYGGGTVQYTGNVLDVKENQWVMLLNDPTTPTVAKWYRVVGVGMIGSGDTNHLSLVGPDWEDASNDATLVVVDGVTGVYSTTMRIDDSLIWTK